MLKKRKITHDNNDTSLNDDKMIKQYVTIHSNTNTNISTH